VSAKEPKDGPPFEVELHLGGGVVVPFVISEAAIRVHRNPTIKYTAETGTREGYRTGAVTIVQGMLDADDKRPVEVVDEHGSYWIIPTRSIMAVRFRDTTLVRVSNRSASP
jgi:hypothetical protein